MPVILIELIKTVHWRVECGIFSLCLWMLLVCEESNIGVCVLMCVCVTHTVCLHSFASIRKSVPFHIVIARMRVTPVSAVVKFRELLLILPMQLLLKIH